MNYNTVITILWVYILLHWPACTITSVVFINKKSKNSGNILKNLTPKNLFSAFLYITNIMPIFIIFATLSTYTSEPTKTPLNFHEAKPNFIGLLIIIFLDTYILHYFLLRRELLKNIGHEKTNILSSREILNSLPLISPEKRSKIIWTRKIAFLFWIFLVSSIVLL